MDESFDYTWNGELRLRQHRCIRLDHRPVDVETREGWRLERKGPSWARELVCTDVEEVQEDHEDFTTGLCAQETAGKTCRPSEGIAISDEDGSSQFHRIDLVGGRGRRRFRDRMFRFLRSEAASGDQRPETSTHPAAAGSQPASQPYPGHHVTALLEFWSV